MANRLLDTILAWVVVFWITFLVILMVDVVLIKFFGFNITAENSGAIPLAKLFGTMYALFYFINYKRS